MLVSGGARAFADKRGIACVTPDTLVSDRARAEWQMWKTRLDAALSGNVPAHDKQDLRRVQDTVGAVAWDRQADLAAGVSRCAPRGEYEQPIYDLVQRRASS